MLRYVNGIFFHFLYSNTVTLSCDESVAEFMRESIVRDSFGSCGHDICVLSISEVNFIVGYLTTA